MKSNKRGERPAVVVNIYIGDTGKDKAKAKSRYKAPGIMLGLLAAGICQHLLTGSSSLLALLWELAMGT